VRRIEEEMKNTKIRMRRFEDAEAAEQRKVCDKMLVNFDLQKEIKKYKEKIEKVKKKLASLEHEEARKDAL